MQNFSTVSAFLSSFESHCSSQASVTRLRAHPSYSSFLSKWTLPVYFQLRSAGWAGSTSWVGVDYQLGGRGLPAGWVWSTSWVGVNFNYYYRFQDIAGRVEEALTEPTLKG